MQQENETITEITLLGGRVPLVVPAVGGFRPGLDAVLLAAACPAGPGETVLDMGCGTGAAGLCLLSRVPSVCLTGVEIISDIAALAKQNAELNKVAEKTVFITGDILTPLSGVPDYGFDHVICNPPYLKAGTYMTSPDEVRAHAIGHNTEKGDDLSLWVRAAHRALKSKGTLTMVHRADHVDDVVLALGRMFGAIEIIPFWPHAGEPARRVVIRAGKDRRGPCVLQAGIVLHELDGSWTSAARAVLEQAHGM